MTSTIRLRSVPRDGGMLHFDRETGWNVLVRSDATLAETQRAPRVVQFGLSNRCNLRCTFCYRPRDHEPRWTADDVVTWARALDRAGVVELVFGEGEPLLFPAFPALLRRLRAETDLAVGFTTNGTRLSEALLQDLAGCYSEMRLSVYEENRPLERVQLLARAGASFGVNVLVTPERVGTLPRLLGALIGEGCRDVLLLPYVGPDPALHLSPEDDRRLAAQILDLYEAHGLSVQIKLGVCFGRRLFEVPQLRIWSGCGAGDDFVSIDSAGRVRSCSFHHLGVLAETPAQVIDLWREARRTRAPAAARGCARPLSEGAGMSPPEAPLLVWQAFAGNNSSSYTMVGEFATEARARRYVEALDTARRRARESLDRSRAHEDDERASRHWDVPLWSLLGFHPRSPRPAPPERSSGEGSPEDPDAADALNDVPAGDIPYTLRKTASDFLESYPQELHAIGRRVVARHSGLYCRDVLTGLLVKRHGRVLHWGGYGDDAMALLLAFEPGPRRDEVVESLRHRVFAWSGDRIYVLASPSYLWHPPAAWGAIPGAVHPLSASEFEWDRAAPRLAAEVARKPAPRRDAEVFEHLLLRDGGFGDEVLRDPLGVIRAEVTDEYGWEAPARWPREMSLFPMGEQTLLTARGAPLPTPMFFYVHRWGARSSTLVAGRTLGFWFSGHYPSEPASLRAATDRFIASVTGAARAGAGALHRIDPSLNRFHVDVEPRDRGRSLAVALAVARREGVYLQSCGIRAADPLRAALDVVNAELDLASRRA